MLARFFMATAVTLTAVLQVYGQTAASDAQETGDSAWRRAGEAASSAAATASRNNSVVPSKASSSLQGEARRPVTRVTSGTDTLPNSHGQVWREYDISPYTLRVTSTKRPEQAIIDWIFRETGYEAWHSEPLGILSATKRALRVYHTPEMQTVVAELVDRFVGSEAESRTFSLRVITLDSPSWRARARSLLRPVTVHTPGTNAWLLEKEDAAILLAQLQRRTDYREHSSPHLLVNNGQATVVSATRSRPYICDVAIRPTAWPGYEAQPGKIDEGFTLEFSPLLTTDRALIDATIGCNIDQVEKMIPVVVELPTPAAPRQRTQIEVPQMTHFRFRERFCWPVEQVLLVGMGMVALPVPVDAKSKTLLPGIPVPGTKAPPRADLLVLVEAKDHVGPATRVSRGPRGQAGTYRNRY